MTSLGRREGLLFGLAPLAEVASRELSWDPTASHRELIWAQVCSGNSWYNSTQVIVTIQYNSSTLATRNRIPLLASFVTQLADGCPMVVCQPKVLRPEPAVAESLAGKKVAASRQQLLIDSGLEHVMRVAD